MTRHTPLEAVHTDLGATFTEFAGWRMPLRYTSEIAEHTAVRTAAGLFDLSHMGEIAVTGPEAGAALDHALVNRPSAIRPGRARYSMICDPRGGIIDDLVVYRLTDERFLVVANAANVAEVAAELTARAGGFDADVTDESDAWALIALQGPAATGILGPLTTADLPGLRYYAITAAAVAGVEVLLARTGYTGEDGFELYAAPTDAPALWSAISAAGAGHGLVPAGLACRDTLRLEAGMPLFGHELSRDTTPYEAGLGRVVDLAKPGGFVGGEALAAAQARGVDRTLVGLVASGRRSPRAGQDVIDPASGQAVGAVTSGAPSPTLGRPIALAYVPPRLADPGTAVRVDIRGRFTDAEIVALPFYSRPR